jgi:hypothetical protein
MVDPNLWVELSLLERRTLIMWGCPSVTKAYVCGEGVVYDMKGQSTQYVYI